MNDSGYVYVLMNPSLKNMVKIGKTTREPEERAKELSAATGIPTPFIVVYSCLFESCTEAESFVHTYLESNGFRVASNREFFEIPINMAIDAVIKAKEHFTNNFNNISFMNENYDDSLESCNAYNDVYQLAESYFYGENNTLRNYEKALDFYKKACILGTVDAFYDVASIYYDGIGIKQNIKKAYEYASEGAIRGNLHCINILISIYIKENDFSNVIRCLELYISKKYFDYLCDINDSYFSEYGLVGNLLKIMEESLYSIKYSNPQILIDYNLRFKEILSNFNIHINNSDKFNDLNKEYISNKIVDIKTSI